jgi:short-subunit dehydrogenase
MTASPNNGVYSASKSALESATDTLRNEVFRFGISVSLIIPGSVDTSSHYQRSVHSDALRVQLTPIQKNLYEPLVKGSEVIEKETSKHKSGTNLTTRAFFHALFSETPKSRYMVGLDSKLTRGIRWVFSDRLLDWGYQLLMYQFEKHD